MELCDNYDHPDPGLVYCTTNIPGVMHSAEVPHPINFIELDNGCDCTTNCSQFCFHPGCTVGGGTNNYECGLLDLSKLGYPIFECNSTCRCEPSRCFNRIVQIGPHPHLKISKVNEKGYGLFCTAELKKGEFVCEYAGEIIDQTIAKERFDVQTAKNKSNYILILREYSGKNLTCKTIVDPTVVGNIGRYCNHSCEPNLVMVPVRIHTLIPHLALFAAKPIEQGEELCFDYGDPGSGGEHNQLIEQNIDNEQLKRRTRCYCGSIQCRGYLPFDQELCI